MTADAPRRPDAEGVDRLTSAVTRVGAEIMNAVDELMQISQAVAQEFAGTKTGPYILSDAEGPAVLTPSCITKLQDVNEEAAFKDRLRELRQRAGLSQAALSKTSGIPPAVISRMESGHRTPSLSTLIALVKALRCDANVLLGLANAPSAGGLVGAGDA